MYLRHDSELERPYSTPSKVKKKHISQVVKLRTVGRESEEFIVPVIMQTAKLHIGKELYFIQVFNGGKSE